MPQLTLDRRCLQSAVSLQSAVTRKRARLPRSGCRGSYQQTREFLAFCASHRRNCSSGLNLRLLQASQSHRHRIDYLLLNRRETGPVFAAGADWISSASWTRIAGLLLDAAGSAARLTSWAVSCFLAYSAGRAKSTWGCSCIAANSSLPTAAAKATTTGSRLTIQSMNPWCFASRSSPTRFSSVGQAVVVAVKLSLADWARFAKGSGSCPADLSSHFVRRSGVEHSVSFKPECLTHHSACHHSGFCSC